MEGSPRKKPSLLGVLLVNIFQQPFW